MGGDPETLEGYGYNLGATGGTQIVVSNLNDSGVGSLRAACAANGARLVTFSVSGNIELSSRITINNPYITIDGSTAPNGGICVKGFGIDINTTDVIVRHIRIRPGANADPENNDGIYLTSNSRRIMIDHCSLTWAQDENMSCYGDNVTVQYCIISEGLSNSGHPEGEHSRGFFNTGASTHVSVHHNLFAHNSERNPTIAGGRADVINNVCYNNAYPAIVTPETGNADVNYVKNWQKSGTNTIVGSGYPNVRLMQNANPYTMSVYILGNIGPQRLNDALPETDCLYDAAEISHTVANRFSFVGSNPVTETDAVTAMTAVLAGAGATLPKRDAVDARIIADIDAGTGAIIDDPASVGGWPDLTM